MKEALERLRNLQKVLLDLRRTREAQAALPTEHDALDVRCAAAEKRFEEAEGVAEERRSKRRQKELELESIEEKIEKYKAQLMEVKTNREYKALLDEIEHLQGRQSDLETEILTDMEDADREEQEMREAREERDRTVREVEDGHMQLRLQEEKLAADQQRLEEMRAELEKAVPADLLAKFRRIADVRDGLGLVEGRDSTCTACQSPIRPQAWHEVRHTDKLTTCESCGRILFYTREGAG
jgi:predicted  nucleic acid-binding Zn-ribbon protein